MSPDEIRGTLQRVFGEVFEGERFEFSDALGRDTLEAWDSLGHIRLIAATEEAFNIRFTIDEIEGLTNVGKIVARIGSPD
jgi:acyl carrier protein